MTWLLIRTPTGSTAVEHHALVRETDSVISGHLTYPDACAALVAYRARQEREAAEAAGQGELEFGGEA